MRRSAVSTARRFIVRAILAFTLALVACRALPSGDEEAKVEKHASAIGACGDGAPILVLKDTSSPNDRNLYQHYIPEILKTEGLPEYAEAEVSSLTGSCLATHSVVILPSISLSTGVASLLRTYVANGGYLIGLRPDLQLADVFNVSASAGSGHLCRYDGQTSSLDSLCADAGRVDAGSEANCTADAVQTGASCAWCTTAAIALDTSHPALQTLESRTVRIHGPAKKYTSLSGTQKLATLYDGTSALSNPAITYYANGSGGAAVLFAYDLAESVVLTRQGNPYLAGPNLTTSTFTTMRAAQMFRDDRVTGSAPWNGTLKGVLPQERNDVPQADEQMHALTNLIIWARRTQKPIPRLWYYENGSKAALTVSSDYEFVSPSAVQQQLTEVEDAGGRMAQYVLPGADTTALPVATAQQWQAAGHEVSIHFDALTDAGAVRDTLNYVDMRSDVITYLGQFNSKFGPSIQPKTSRNHWLAWVSRGPGNEKDPAAMARIFQNDSSIALDTSYSTVPFSYGYMTGSGLPMRFLDFCPSTPSAPVLSVSELATQFEDDAQVLIPAPGDPDISLRWRSASSTSRYHAALLDSWNRYHTAVNPLFHTLHWDASEKLRHRAWPLFELANNLAIPIRSPANLWTYWSQRNAIRFESVAFASNTLTFTAASAVPGATILLPLGTETIALQSVSVGGTSVPFTVDYLQGLPYGIITLQSSGNLSISASYGSGYKISGSVGSAAAATTRVLITGAPTADTTKRIHVTLRPDSTGAYALTALRPGIYLVRPISDTYAFAPASTSVTIASSDGTASFSASAGVDATGAGQSLLTSEIPESDNLNGATSYELGMRFRPRVSGVITHLRYWRAKDETGGATLRLWSSTGGLLASKNDLEPCFGAPCSAGPNGWRQVKLDAAVPVSAGQEYVVSSNAVWYPATTQGFAGIVQNGYLESYPSSGAGVYGSAGQFPQIPHLNTNYFRDVVFVPANQTVLAAQGSPSTVSGTYELGMKFSSSVDAEVRAIRYWRTSSAAATGRIWDAAAGVLATISIPSESGTGWKQYELTSPLPIDTTHTYIVSVEANAAAYPYTYFEFVNPVSNPPLAAPQHAGVYSTVLGTKPSSTYNSTGYYRDVVVSRAQEILRGLTPASSTPSSAPWELGTRFSSNAAGRITAVRFYKASSNDAGTHVGKIWTSNGKLLAAVIFRAEMDSGWQEEPLPVPILIQPGITYVVSVNAGREPERTSSTPYNYVYTANGFLSSRSYRHLTVPASGAVYNQGAGVFPQTTTAYNYFRDVVFVPD